MSQAITVSAPQGGAAQEVAHGDAAAFSADPVAYIRTHACLLHPELYAPGGSDDLTNATFNRALCGTRGIEFMRTNETRLGATLVVAVRDVPGLPLIRVLESNNHAHKRVCFLPWQEDKCTLTKMSSRATVFLTGPLTGCNVYLAAKDGHRLLAFHGNLNSDGEDRNTNNVRKDKEAINIATERGYILTHRLARGDYQIPAFVWGERTGPTWTCYVHEVDPVTRRFTNKPLPTI
ncbi:hypothetical protein [Neoroseomonas rubea]|uniref:hypothetical protein n=1 Tax=Neoroseomonas rubea TaxID=2748666 RepID=UPI0018E01245|nr:hypothetical protein [Roseomonas rubea]